MVSASSFCLSCVLVRVSIQLTFPHCCSSLKQVRTGTQIGQETGAHAEATEGCSLLACFPCLLSLLSYRTQDYQPRDGIGHNGPSLLDHQLRKRPTAESHGGTSPNEAPFSVITTVFVKLTHKTSQYKFLP